MSPEALFGLLSDAVRRERLWTTDAANPHGSYLENGSRFYLDSGGHPEYSTPECWSPRQVACHDKAGERLLDAARTQVVRARPGLELTIVKNNVAAACPEGATWGSHEAYTSWIPVEQAAPQMIPHLV